MINSDQNKDNKQASSFAKYTGIAFQMLATIGVFCFIGYKIDQNRSSSKFIFTAILGLIGVVVSLISVVRSLSKNN